MRLSVSIVLLLACPLGAQDRPAEFHLTFADNVSATLFTGRVFLIASKQEIKSGVFRQGWFKPEPFFAQDVKDWKPGETLTFKPQFQFPDPLAKLPAGKYYLQAIMDRQGGQSPLSGPSNGYSKAVAANLDVDKSGPVKLVIDQVVATRKFEEKPRVKLVDIESKLLTEFHGRPMRLRAGVVLPKSYAEDPKGQYPVNYEIPGFGGDHFFAFSVEGRKEIEGAEEMIHVMLDPSCRLGHHVFADSDNNGPYGKALIEELIPHVERTFRAAGKPGGRFVTGHSSGGWSSLWLQVTYPDFFGGCWSTAPDPVDFRDFQMVDLYQAGINLFTDAEGKSRPLARSKDKVLVHYKPFSDMEVVLGRGGQLFSFEAVFSPKGPDGQPMRLWDRETGKVDAKVAQAWQRYDIRLILEKNWKTLGPKLAGKIHVYTGGEDTFYLDGATALLQKSLKGLGSDAVVEIFPGRHHGDLIDQALRLRLLTEMAAAWGQGKHTVPFTTLVKEFAGGPQEGFEKVIRTAEEWEQFLKTCPAQAAKTLKTKKLDFAKESVIAVGYLDFGPSIPGKERAGGIAQIRAEAGKWVVQYESVAPADDGPHASAPISVHVVSTTPAPKEVRFEQKTRRLKK